MTNVVEIKGNALQEVVSTNSEVLVDFYATWCGPCKMIAPMLDAISTDNPEIKVVKINIDDPESIDIVKGFGIRGVPTLVHYKDGVTVGTSVGGKTKGQIMTFLGR